jgi:hypothetical protein
MRGFKEHERQTGSAANMMNFAIFSAADPATTNTFQQPAAATASFVTPASRLASCKSHDQDNSHRAHRCKSARYITGPNRWPRYIANAKLHHETIPA